MTALLVSQDRRHLLVTPWLRGKGVKDPIIRQEKLVGPVHYFICAKEFHILASKHKEYFLTTPPSPSLPETLKR
jgi:hypothetical protein